MLGLLALLLGFTFTMALQRYDTRSQAVTEEANAIGTAYPRMELLPDQVRRRCRRLGQPAAGNDASVTAHLPDQDDPPSRPITAR